MCESSYSKVFINYNIDYKLAIPFAENKIKK